VTIRDEDFKTSLTLENVGFVTRTALPAPP
jgi:hypothetical protein